MNNAVINNSEHGGAGVKLVIILVVLILAANAGYNYVPIAYEGANFKQEMQTAVVNGLATPGKLNPIEVIKNRLQRSAVDNNLPPDTFIEVKQVGDVIQARAVYSKKVGLLPFGLYTYTYNFDYVAVPAGFLLKSSK